jgi:hypothetical protein
MLAVLLRWELKSRSIAQIIPTCSFADIVAAALSRVQRILRGGPASPTGHTSGNTISHIRAARAMGDLA